LSSVRKISRRKFLYTGAAGAVGLGVFSAEGLRESYDVRLVKLEMPLRRLPPAFDGFTIAQLSDFHYDDRFSVVPIRKSVEIVNRLRPDLVVLTGDFVTVPMFTQRRVPRRVAAAATPCAEILKDLRAPKYAVLGNHDAKANPEAIVRILEQRGISVMRNQSVPLERGNGRIWLAGIDDLLQGVPRLSPTIAQIPPDETTILMAHEPDFADHVSSFPIDLQLSGHSHGGQVWIPGIGAPWLPPMATRYPRGLYHIGDLTLYTNIGIGTIRVPMRINCPPEVTLITLRSVPRGASDDQK
jgi:uncharacterized protein